MCDLLMTWEWTRMIHIQIERNPPVLPANLSQETISG